MSRNLNNSNKTKKCSADIDTLYNFFKVLNENEGAETCDNIINQSDTVNELLNSPITREEIVNSINSLKNNKASGYDNVMNEHIKTTMSNFLPLYENLFNIIFDTGIVPEEWLIGIIRPIYKNKGNPSNPENYRPITLLSCLGKVFTNILETRIEHFADDISLIKESQAGFRKGFSTLDNILVLQFLTHTHTDQQ